MTFELNPFRLLTERLTEIKSITVVSNLDWLNVPADPLTGENISLPISAKTNVAALRVFATGVGPGTPSMISLLSSHIPNLSISQITGLQPALNSLVKTFISGNAPAIAVTNNGSGDYTITPNFGTLVNTIAQGNDNRFPASITGIRKGAGVGSLDTAAVVKVDYWNTDVFVASGALHAKGLVPDPGASAGTTKFLREDGTWVIPAGSGTVTSVGLALPGIFSVSGSPVTGAGTLTGALVNQAANLIFAGPTTGGPAAPTFRAHVFADISALIGTGASNIALGSDTRFPSSVTGLRKSAGVGSTDTAAIRLTDYWDNTVFGGKGPSHSIGLVPDPGAGTAPYVRYLRDDGTWQVFIPDTASLVNSQLAVMGPKTLKANATAGIASPTDVDAKTARSTSLLNLESVTTHGNSDYTMLAADKYVATSATLTAIRTWTLPLANSFNPGQQITVSDDSGAINGTFTLNIARQGADTIQGMTAPISLDSQFASITLSSNGSNGWAVVSRNPPARIIILMSNGTYTPPTGVKSLFVEGIGAGGGGAGAQASGGNTAAGAGGGGGAYASINIKSPAASYAVTIGSPGAGGATGNGSGGSGGNTLFGSVLRANGGIGGTCTGGGSAIAVNGIAGDSNSVSGLGDTLSSGCPGYNSFRLSGTVGISGNGGASRFAGGGLALTAQAGGSIGGLPGGGGSGALSTSATGFLGGAGNQGMIRIWEFY